MLEIMFFILLSYILCSLKHVPLSQGELSACPACLILIEVGDQIRAHSDVGSSVAAYLVVVRC